MHISFSYSNIEFKQQEQGNGLVIRGMITNRSGRNYTSVVFRIVIFIKNTPIGSVMLTINGFRMGQMKMFEKRVGELIYSKVVGTITRYEIYVESAY